MISKHSHCQSVKPRCKAHSYFQVERGKCLFHPYDVARMTISTWWKRFLYLLRNCSRHSLISVQAINQWFFPTPQMLVLLNKCMLVPEMCWRDWQWRQRWTRWGREAAWSSSSIQLAKSPTSLWVSLRCASKGRKTGIEQKSQTGSPTGELFGLNNIFNKF